MNGTTLSPFLQKRWIFGIPAPIWLKNLELIEEVIRKNKLQPVDRGSLLSLALPEAAAGEKEKSAKLVLDRRPYPGGIRIAHLHFKGDLYILKEDLWKEFSGRIVKDFQTKLANVRSVSFEGAMELSEAIDSLG